MNTTKLSARDHGALWKLVFRLPVLPLDMTEVKVSFLLLNSAMVIIGQHPSIISVVRARCLRYARAKHPDPEMATVRDFMQAAREAGASF